MNYLNKAKEAKNDEFYTRYEDVKAELIHGKDRLKDKKIICPCDGPESAFVKFLNDVKDDWGIKSIDCCCWPVSMLDIDYTKYDVLITNPPYSIYKDILSAIVGKIDFIMLAPWLIAYTKYFSDYGNDKKIFLGYGRHLPLGFTNTDKKVACSWISSFDDYNISRRHFDCPDWTEFTITAMDYISSYDYIYEVCQCAKNNPKKYNFHIYLKKNIV